MIGRGPDPGRRRRLRLRVLVIFGAGSAVLTAGVAAVVYQRSSGYLVAQRRTYATRQAFANARLVEDLARSSPLPALPELLGSLETPAGSIPVLYRSGTWFSPHDRRPEEASVPASLSQVVIEQRRQIDRRFGDGSSRLAVGVPLAGGDAYFEVFPLTELGGTLGALRLALVAGAVMTMLGSVALGAWAGRKLLGPVVEIGRTAVAITGGERHRRLDVGGYEEFAELAASFNQMVGHLNERIELDARFASNVSHELRSPLTTLSTAVQGMQARRDLLDERTGRLLDVLSEEVTRFEGLVEDLLDISRADGAATLRREEMTVGEVAVIAAELSGAMPPTVEGGGTTAAAVRIDRRRLRRILANLVRNAETHGGGLVGLRLVAAPGGLRVEVDDAGPGVPPEERTRIFQRFYRRRREAGHRASGEGVGLGLALVAEHVRLHDGRVWVEDRGGGGARFVVEFPTVAGTDRGLTGRMVPTPGSGER